MTSTAPTAAALRPRSGQHRTALKRHGELIDAPGRVGPLDDLSVEEILDLFPSLPIWAGLPERRRRDRIAGARRLLIWLRGHPGEGWQQRWHAGGADEDRDWLDRALADDPRAHSTTYPEAIMGLCCLLLCRTVLPSYRFLAAYHAHKLFDYVQQTLRPDLFAAVERRATEMGIAPRRCRQALGVICKIVLHTGRDVDQLTAEDLFGFRAWCYREYGKNSQSTHLAWALLHGIADLGEHASMQNALRFGQRPTGERVDAYRISCRPIRDVLVRYLDERRPGIDYSTLTRLTGVLAGTFWADIEAHHPDIDTLRLPDEVVHAWKHRLQTITAKDGTTRPRKNYLAVLVLVRAFYLDIQQWALEDPSWVLWAVPSPIRSGDLHGIGKHLKKTAAAMHQRVRERLPHLPVLVDSAEQHRAEQASFLTLASATPPGQVFSHGGREFVRPVPSGGHQPSRIGSGRVIVKDLATGERIDVTQTEDEAFWAWAIIETLRHTGVRFEELTEITHMALVSYQLPDTREVVPMLQIVPSKTNEERLLLVSPELASVLATIVTRLRGQGDGQIPLVTRYDRLERTTGPALPHLFQRKKGWRSEVPSHTTVQALLQRALTRTGLCDAAGAPLRYTPHDFRRIFATEAVTGGLPVHIAARLLGHASITTTQAYLAVFQDDLVKSYRSFLEKRRATRPAEEYREPTDDEWQEFQQHFHARKVELGECGRPYGSSCQHEHACIRCPMLRVSPTQRPRLIEIIRNLGDRITEARANGWLGEVQGLQVSLTDAKKKLISLDRSLERMRNNQNQGPTDLGMPVITSPR